MAIKFNLRLCLKLIDQGVSLNNIECQYHISKRTSSKTKKRKEELDFNTADLEKYSDTELGKLFFPEQYDEEELYLSIDYDYVHEELSKPGVNLKLLWKEYCLNVTGGKYPVSYSKFCRGYAAHVKRHEYTNHIEHKPGIRTEVDWAGSTMKYVIPATGEAVKVYLFVVTLPFSQYSYVEATKDMKMDTWINCNRYMFEYFGGSTVRIVCANHDRLFDQELISFDENYRIMTDKLSIEELKCLNVDPNFVLPVEYQNEERKQNLAKHREKYYIGLIFKD